jgi:hypothetical protein
VNQFLASRNIDSTFKQAGWRFLVKASFYHRVIGAADDVTARMKMQIHARSCVVRQHCAG